MVNQNRRSLMCACLLITSSEWRYGVPMNTNTLRYNVCGIPVSSMPVHFRKDEALHLRRLDVNENVFHSWDGSPNRAALQFARYHVQHCHVTQYTCLAICVCSAQCARANSGYLQVTWEHVKVHDGWPLCCWGTRQYNFVQFSVDFVFVWLRYEIGRGGCLHRA